MYGKGDAKCCKVREKVADVYYKSGKTNEAIEELKKVEVNGNVYILKDC